LVDGGVPPYTCKDILVFDDPKILRVIMDRTCWRILNLLCRGEMYPIEIARRLGVHEQNVYYHIRKLVKAGIVEVAREENHKGALTRYYRVSFPAFGVELPFGERMMEPLPTVDEKLRLFFKPFIDERGCFDGKIVVGSPDPHGPFKARARDGHYAAHLAFLLGRFIRLPSSFIVKLDVDVKAEKERGGNLILVGGPGTNLITREVNRFLPVRFNVMTSAHGFLLGGLVSERTGNVYMGDTVGVVARIPNPWNPDRWVLVLAGNKAVGTKACVIALTNFANETLRNFDGEPSFATVIQGFDLDGDGKVDSIEILE